MPRRRTSSLVVSRRKGVWTLTLVLADGRLSEEVHAALIAACGEIDLDEEARLVVVKSRGSAFALGDDATVTMESPDGIAAVGRLRVPSMAILAGDALDAGLELALACDLRLAASSARMGLTQLETGQLPRHGGTQRLPRIVGPAVAARLLFFGEQLRARAALDAGLVHRVCRRETLATETRKLVVSVASRAPLAQRLAKETLRAAGDLPLAEGLRLEGDLYVLLQTTADHQEGVASFLGKRSARFRGR